MSDEVIDLLNTVRGMKPGDVHVLREEHIPPSTIHFYRDGWYVLFDFPKGRAALPPGGTIGFRFHHHEDICEFLLCTMGERVLNFAIKGTGQ